MDIMKGGGDDGEVGDIGGGPGADISVRLCRQEMITLLDRYARLHFMQINVRTFEPFLPTGLQHVETPMFF
jgi:hypothetical protein